MVRERGDGLVSFALPEGESDRKDAREELKKESRIWRREKGQHERGLALLMTLTAFFVQRNKAR